MIGIRSMQQRRIEHEWRERRVLKFEEKRGKKKKKRNERDHNDIRYCDFITAELILFGSESLRIAFRFRGVKTPAANTLQYPSFLPCLRSSLPLFSRVNTFPAPIIPHQPRGRTGKTPRRHWIVSIHVFLLLRSRISNASSYPLASFFLRLPPTIVRRCVRVFRFTERVSRDVTPHPSSLSPRSSFFLQLETLSSHSTSGQPSKTSHFETKEEGFLGYRPFPPFEPLPRVVSLPSSTPLCSPLLRARGKKVKCEKKSEGERFIHPVATILPRETMLLCRP